MVTYIESLLQEKTRGRKDEILFTQWQLAKDYVPQVLATISNLFPHYTLHDKSHSETILANIGRIIKKDTFERFSAIDLWMLLCCAFYHDIGMAVFATDLSNILKENDFLSYFSEIQENKNHILHKQSEYFKIQDKTICFKDSDISLEKIESIKFILAEYIRSVHSKRSENVLDNEPSIYLPNNPIPRRLIKLLGKICECHTECFEKVMELPFEEMGPDYDECHPRYIACLLRLGDLLDLDNNRVSDIVLRSVAKIPDESFFHIKKHLSISHIQMNSKQIDITAECEDYRTADLASSWFSWLDSEITNQMKSWNKIVPAPDYGFLPTVENLKVELRNYDTIDGKLHPKFEIDSQRAMEMLQGAGLYSEPYQCIREILQNAVDATYFRIWLENKTKGASFIKEDFEKECRKDEYTIKVFIKKERKVLGDCVLWHISVSDSGLGMSKEDLQFLCKTGSSYRNVEKQRMLSEMPEWMKPSGTFGIGFQSVFLLTDKVHIKTRKYNRENIYDIDLYSPTGDEKGTVLVKTGCDDKFLSGTTLDFDFTVKKLPESISLSSEHTFSNYAILDYDFVESDSFDFEICKIIDEIIRFSRASYVSTSLRIDDGSANQEIIKPNADRNIEFSYYSEDTNIEISVNGVNQSLCEIFYRNQSVRHAPIWFNFLHILVNILGGNAKEKLSLNRNELNRKYVNVLRAEIISTTIDYIRNNFSHFTSEMKQFASMFVCVYKGTKETIDSGTDIFNEWKKYKVRVDKNGQENQMTIKELFDSVNVVKIKDANKDIHRNIFKLQDNELLIDFESGFFSLSNDEAVFFHYILPYYFRNCSYVHESEIEYVFSNDSTLPIISDAGWKTWFQRVYLENWTARGLMPCDKEYEDLALADDSRVPYVYGLGIPKGISYSRMASPYIIKHEDHCKRVEVSISDKLIDFVYENRKNKTTTKEKIKEVYERFVADRKSVIDEINRDFEEAKRR